MVYTHALVRVPESGRVVIEAAGDSFVLIIESCNNCDTGMSRLCGARDRHRIDLSILQTCQQIRKEGSEILLTRNKFSFSFSNHWDLVALNDNFTLNGHNLREIKISNMCTTRWGIDLAQNLRQFVSLFPNVGKADLTFWIDKKGCNVNAPMRKKLFNHMLLLREWPLKEVTIEIIPRQHSGRVVSWALRNILDTLAADSKSFLMRTEGFQTEEAWEVWSSYRLMVAMVGNGNASSAQGN